MNAQKITNPQNPLAGTVSFISLGGSEDVTRNMYLYEYKDQILIVDCGLGFPDESMLGVDLLLPDTTYLLEQVKAGKKIVGMLFTHGHEDHIGGLPFILPQFIPQGAKEPKFPMYASPLTAALANEKLSEFTMARSIKTVNFEDKPLKIGDFTVSFIRVTHSVPDSANIFIKTPVGNFFHGSDFKFDLSPADGKRSDFARMVQAGEEGVLCLMSDCLGSDRSGFTPSEEKLGINFEREMRECKGKCIITTFSSNISRFNQAIAAAEKVNRKVCFVGRSMLKLKQIGDNLGYLKMKPGTEVQITDIKKYKSNQLVFIVAGSQGQEYSAMTRIGSGEHRDVKLAPDDVVIFSSDPIPGNEVPVQELVDMIVKRGAKVVHSTESEAFHVSGHGSTGDHMLLVALTKPKFLLPISGTYSNMVAYKDMGVKMGYAKKDIYLIENGQEVLFSPETAKFGKRFEIKNVYVDKVSGEEVDHYVVRDRERLGHEGIVIVMAEIKTSDGQLAEQPEFVVRGSSLVDTNQFAPALRAEIQRGLSGDKEKVINWIHKRKMIGDITARFLYKKYRTRPLILPVVIEV